MVGGESRASWNASARQQVVWRERDYPSRRWQRLWVRTVARAEVLAPDGRAYAIRVFRLLWPGGSGQLALIGTPLDVVEGAAAMFTSRVVWAVRVLDTTGRFPLRSVVFGEEWRHRQDAVRRAHQIAEQLLQGDKLGRRA